MAERLKSGSITKKHGAWYWRHYVGKNQVWERVADVNDKFRSKGDVIRLINKREVPDVDGEDSKITDFIDKVYLPWAQRNKRPSTYNGYVKLAKAVKGHVGEMRLSEYRPHHCTRYLGSLAPTMTSNSLQHIRGFLSGVFTAAVDDGRIEVNPIRDAKCRETCKPSAESQHYTAAEMRGILTIFTGRERAIMALSFVGLRPSEIIGLRVEDLTQDAILIQRSLWHGHVSDGGKSKRSRRAIPIGPTVAAILAEHLQSSPSVSGFVFENTRGNPLNTAGLEKLTRDVLRPTIEKHGYTWKKMYAGRHGAVTEVNRHLNTEKAAFMFGHRPEIEAANYLHEIPEETRRAGLALDATLSDEQETNLEIIGT